MSMEAMTRFQFDYFLDVATLRKDADLRAKV